MLLRREVREAGHRDRELERLATRPAVAEPDVLRVEDHEREVRRLRLREAGALGELRVPRVLEERVHLRHEQPVRRVAGVLQHEAHDELLRAWLEHVLDGRLMAERPGKERAEEIGRAHV